MAYCTVYDVLGELHPTLRREMENHYNEAHANNPLDPDFEQTIRDHIAKAEAAANASLSRAYKTPIKEVTGVITSLTCKIAAYFAAAAYSEREQILIDKYETAKMMLDNLVEAANPSLVDQNPGDDDSSFVCGGYGSDPKIFTRSVLKSWSR